MGHYDPSSDSSILPHETRLSKKDISTTIESSLPSQFYHSASIYELEKRAVFHQRWILISHEARYRNVGDYVQYDIAGFNFVIVRNKMGKLLGFHNICRYHGWSYNLNGELTKAPRFDAASSPDFDATSVKLLDIHVHVDQNGFVYINFDARKGGPKITWDEQYNGLDQQALLTQVGIDWSTVEYDFSWTREGKYNWKLMQDNYNECYHCLTAHPEVAKTTRLDNYFVEPSEQGTYICHFNEPKSSSSPSSSSSLSSSSSKPTQPFTKTRFSSRSATWVFPLSHFSPNPGTGFMHMMRTVPTSATTVRQEYDVYKLHTPTASPEAHQRMVAFYKQVTSEDVELCEAVQRNHERGLGLFGGGPLHPFHEEGVLAFQQAVKKMLVAHQAEEKVAGREIDPAKRSGHVDEGCARILACAGESSALNW